MMIADAASSNSSGQTKRKYLSYPTLAIASPPTRVTDVGDHSSVNPWPEIQAAIVVARLTPAKSASQPHHQRRSPHVRGTSRDEPHDFLLTHPGHHADQHGGEDEPRCDPDQAGDDGQSCHCRRKAERTLRLGRLGGGGLNGLRSFHDSQLGGCGTGSALSQVDSDTPSTRMV